MNFFIVESSLSDIFRLSKYEKTIMFSFSRLIKINSEGPFLGMRIFYPPQAR
jgi:hypothetical protein